ncbi:MAG TPA: hypothetical protein VHB78_06170 [Vicinamibacterales bacterium]|jgi:hypothetical protein|nr:hypothetical protein [Vicinamibacterales bacterium]
MTELAVPAPAAIDARKKTASRIFLGALLFNAVLTVFWLHAMARGEASTFAHGYQVDREAIGRVLSGIVFFYVIWGFIWWGIKSALLKGVVGFTPEDRRAAFSSRMDQPYDVPALVSRYSERRIRIVDMIGRRGRFITLAAAGFYYLYVQVAQHPEANFAMGFIQDNLFDAVVTGWVFLGVYYLNGWIGAVFYGPQSRVMDGMLARANCLLITTLWAGFKFIMVPVGAHLAAVFPRQEFAPIFAMIWGSYIANDTCAEVFGSLFGKQKIKVWGVGDVNRKSIAGLVAGFLGAFVLCAGVVASQHLGPSWYGLSLAIAVSTSFFELYSPRGSDDFTMATANALICWAFGAWVR